MKHTKKLALFVIFMILVNAFGITAFAVIPNAAGNNNEAVSTLVALEILKGDENGDLNLDQKVNRAEFAAIIARVLGMEDIQLQNADSVFTDVSPLHWASTYINLLANMKIVNGVGANKFEPSSFVKYQEAIKILVCILNYKPQAEMSGGYPTGYLTVAQQLKMLKGLSIDFQADMTRQEVAQLVFNSFDVDVMQNTAIGEYNQYSTVKGENLLYLYQNIKTEEGFVTGINGSKVNDSETLRQDQIEIDEIKYQIHDIDKFTTAVGDLENYLGAYVKYYYVTENENSEIIYIYQLDKRTSEMQINANNIVDVTGLGSGFEIEYIKDENDNTDKISLSNELSVVYNGKKVSDFEITAELFEVQTGSLKLIDNDDNGDYDLVIIKDYEVYVIETVRLLEDKMVIRDPYRRTKQFLFDNTRKYEIQFEDGQPARFEDIEVDVILHVAQSVDEEITEFVISKNAQEGTLVELGENGYFRIETNELELIEGEISKDLLSISDDLPEIGDSGIFYFDLSSNLAGFKAGFHSINDNYAVLLDVEYDKNGVNPDTKIKLLTADNKLSAFQLDEKIYFKNDYYTANKRYELSEIQNQLLQGVREVITYRLNNEGKVTHLYVAKSTPDDNVVSLDLPLSVLDYKNNVFANRYKVNYNTVVFEMPYDVTDESKFSVGNPMDYFTNDDYRVTLYDIDESYTVGAIVYSPLEPGYERPVSIDKLNSSVVLIDKVTKKYVDEEIKTVLKGLQGGKEVEILLSEDVATTGNLENVFRTGNVIQYETNENELKYADSSGEEEELILYELLYDAQNPPEMGQVWDGTSVINNDAQRITAYGTVSAIYDNTLVLSFDNGEEVPFFIDFGTVVYEVNLAKQKVRLASEYDIYEGLNIFIRQRNQRTREIVIIN